MDLSTYFPDLFTGSLNTYALNLIWYFLLGVLLAGYAILDGFDLGVGALHLFAKNDKDRRILLNSIGPVWDGNEVWLVTGGGALFAAFPEAYATVFSGFYLPFMLLLVCLIFRAVAIEFRSKNTSPIWRQSWDISFSLGSMLAPILFGVTLGNLILGIPLDQEYNYSGDILALLNPYALLVGVTTLSLFMMHGSIYLALKTEGDLQLKVRKWVNRTLIFFIICYSITTIATLVYVPRMIENIRIHPIFFLVGILTMLAIANIPRMITKGRDAIAFLSSCLAIVGLFSLFGIGNFPYIVYSSPTVENSLTLINAASSQKTLQIMLIIAILGIPIVLAYTVSIYWIFRGKVKINKMSY